MKKVPTNGKNGVLTVTHQSPHSNYNNVEKKPKGEYLLYTKQICEKESSSFFIPLKFN